MALTLTSMVTITAPAMAAPGDFFICDRVSGNEQVWPKKIGLEDKDDIIETVGLEFKNIKRSGGDISGFSRGKDVSFRLKLRESGQLSIRFQISATSNYYITTLFFFMTKCRSVEHGASTRMRSNGPRRCSSGA